jgi:hypothetical protein
MACQKDMYGPRKVESKKISIKFATYSNKGIQSEIS